jgi:ketosteroid isomerase-like protein
MKRLGFGLLLLATGACACADEAALKTWALQVRGAECRFAASMAQRDLAAFERHLAEPALFFDGPQTLQGRAAVLAAWRPLFEGPQPPFSWEPDQVVAVGDGSLAYSTGLVRDPKGALIGRFASVWRQEAPGQWRIIIDRGVALTEKDKAAPQPEGQGCKGLPN